MSKPSRLLDLPAELRNQIYEYVLTSTDGQLCYREPHSLNLLTKPIFQVPRRFPYIKVAVKPANEFNKLQYVNKQLRKETSALELKYNTLTFTCDQNDDNVSNQLLSFLKCLSPSHASWPMKISLEDWAGRGRNVNLPGDVSYPFTETIETIAEVSRRCRNNPHLAVTWHLSELWIKGRKPLGYLLFVDIALRVAHLTRTRALTDLYKDPELDQESSDCAKHARKGVSVQDLDVENLVFMPMEQRFDEEEWRAMMQDETLQECFHTDKLYALVEEWCTKGI